MKTVHSFRVVDETEYQEGGIFAETDMKISSEAGLEDMLHAFERFLQATGYILPENSYLDFVEDTATPPIRELKGEF